jgi:hypothetical protein
VLEWLPEDAQEIGFVPTAEPPSMIARLTPKRGLIALWCLAAAAGCAKVTETTPTDAAAGPVAATLTVPAVVTAPSIAVDAPEAARLASVDPLSAGGQESINEPSAAIDAPPSAATEVQLSPSVSTSNAPPTAVERPVFAPAAPERREPDRGAELVVSLPAADTLDVTSLLTRLRKTKAINLRTKLAVKNESEDLMERFRAYHAQHGTATLAELRQSYDSLLLKLYSLVEDGDPPLAHDIDRSRAAIWAILTDPMKFGSAAANASPRGVPPA